MRKNSEQKKETNVVGFRLEPEDLQALKRVATRCSLSVHEYAKYVIQEHVSDGGELSILKSRIERTELLLQNLGVDLSIAVRQILLTQEKSELVTPWVERELSCSSWKRGE